MKKYLVIQQKMVGDVLLSSLLCEHLKSNIPNCQVHFLIHEHTAAVVQENPFIDELIKFKPIHRKNKIQFLKFIKELRKENYEAIIDVYCKLESNIISLGLRAPLKISYNKWYSSFIYDKTFKRGKHPKTEMGDAIETRLVLLNPILEQLKNPKEIPKIHLSNEEISNAEQFLKTNHVDLTKPFLIVGALGSSNLKTYPFRYLANLLDTIIAHKEITIILNALPSQKEELATLIQACSEKTQKFIREDIYIADLRSFLAVLSLAKGYFGNEGGAGNMARALGIPNFSIFSPWISKDAWITDKSNKSNVGVHLADFEPDLLNISKTDRKKSAPEYYNRLRPDLIRPKLEAFLIREIFSDQ
ncbi:glycosyltransferase family 9 protein [Croceivirga thetidis]|uniref:Glycosyltransferase family 9 protein n=1 Tax=Croceivirga thetidis TaxID=2721623 RepID=A0ABX1GSK9_9FLAO|nr:glycosyltransferase family 9 protein [Croceivirga thetidis]NKI32911.1 glycosyltransferase family 9 protein [Croceivirga thetidis]